LDPRTIGALHDGFLSVPSARAGPQLLADRTCWARQLSDRRRGVFCGSALGDRSGEAKRLHPGLGFDSRIRLVPDEANDGFPEELGEFLKEVVRRRRDLHMYVLSWDFVMVFAGDREWLPLYKLGWKTHPRPRLAFRLDGKHPVSSSHHQKVVTVDDKVAFVGGLDLTHGRWDTPQHRPVEPRRLDARGQPSRPFHDVQAAVDGPAARALGDLCRDRWLRATGREIAVGEVDHAHDPWPAALAPDLTDTDVAISRTDPGFVTGQAVKEIRHLYVDAIASAQRTLYLENQYFSSSVLGAVLDERLRGAHAPEVVVVSRLTEEGWLEERTMGVLRAHLHKQLQRADVHDRYRLLYPYVPGLEKPNLLNVHSKVLIADDELCSVGSANFNNRSMGFDTECNIAIEARGEPRIQRAIAGLRNRLLAEHLGTGPATVAAETARQGGSLIRTIDELKRPGRTLKPIDPMVAPDVEVLVPATAFIDPERPVDFDKLVYDFVPPEAHQPMAGRVARFAAALLLLAVLGAAWRWTPLGDWIALRSLVSTARSVAHSHWAAFVVLSAYAFGAVVAFPITVLVVVTGIAFGPLLGGLYAFVGVMLNASVTYLAGQALGRHTVRRLAGHRLNRITRRLARRGVVAVALIRVLPVASFWKVNLVAGASYIRRREFLIGTALGVAPAIVLTVLFLGSAEAAINHPSASTFSLLVASTAMLVGSVVYVWRRFGRDVDASQ
jgi:phospholipase D1/2